MQKQIRSETMIKYDAIIIGAGAAGLCAALAATKNGRSILILDMGKTPARKVAVSGGGKCNFTNMAAKYDHYFGDNPDFTRGVLSRITYQDVLNWMKKHRLKWYEKSPGQYFCKSGAPDIVNNILHDINNTPIIQNQIVVDVSKNENLFTIKTINNTFYSNAVIVATGGISFSTLGVSDIGYKIAKRFGHKIIPPRPALCAISIKNFTSDLMGLSLPVKITVDGETINDSLLFTHFGIGGPAVYRTTVRNISNGFTINLMPDIDIYKMITDIKNTSGRTKIVNYLSDYIPSNLAKWIVGDNNKNIADIPKTQIQELVNKITQWHIKPDDIKLYNLSSAEITRGGVSTDKISSKTMESKLCSNLFFAGEVLDVAGDLGGFNLHWAWASGYIAGQNV